LISGSLVSVGFWVSVPPSYGNELINHYSHSKFHVNLNTIIAGVMAMVVEHNLAITVHDLVICTILGLPTGFGMLLFTKN
jgi:hypothetical protein